MAPLLGSMEMASSVALAAGGAGGVLLVAGAAGVVVEAVGIADAAASGIDEGGAEEAALVETASGFCEPPQAMPVARIAVTKMTFETRFKTELMARLP